MLSDDEIAKYKILLQIDYSDKNYEMGIQNDKVENQRF